MNGIAENKRIVTGRTGYIDNLLREGCLVTKLIYSSIANGFVTSIDAKKAKALPGVVDVVTCFDVPDKHFSVLDDVCLTTGVSGHPDSTLLSKRVRCHTDPVAAVVALDVSVANQAAQLIKVEYSTHTNILDYGTDKNAGNRDLHDGVTGNLYGSYETGSFEQLPEDHKSYTGNYMIEPTYAGSTHGCFCFIENDRLVIHTSANGYAVRKTVSNALNIPMSSIKVVSTSDDIGNITFEPLCAYLCKKLSGRPIMINSSVDQFCLRTPMSFNFKTCVSDSGIIMGRTVLIDSNIGAYASNSHEAAISAAKLMRHLYSAQGSYFAKVNSYYTNIPSSKACEGFGATHALFAIESHIDDIAFDLGVDPMLLRIKNCIRAGYGDSIDGYTASSYALDRCIIRGRELTDWDNKRKNIEKQSSDNRKGIGMAIFCYNAGNDQSTANTRLTVHSDGSLTISLAYKPKSATTIAKYRGKVAKIIGIDPDLIVFDYPHDLLPSTNEVATGFALKDAAQRLKSRLIDHARIHLGCDVVQPDIKNGYLTDMQNNHHLMPIFDIVEDIIEKGQSTSVESCNNVADKTLSFGVCFADVTVNISMCKITVDRIITILDNGKVTESDSLLKEGQAAIVDAIAFTLNSPITIDPTTAGINIPGHNKNTISKNNITIEFVDNNEPNTAFGDKPIGDAPFIAVAPAIRNAVLNATGIKLSSLPITSEHLFEEFEQAGMI